MRIKCSAILPSACRNIWLKSQLKIKQVRGMLKKLIKTLRISETHPTRAIEWLIRLYEHNLVSDYSKSRHVKGSIRRSVSKNQSVGARYCSRAARAPPARDARAGARSGDPLYKASRPSWFYHSLRTLRVCMSLALTQPCIYVDLVHWINFTVILILVNMCLAKEDSLSPQKEAQSPRSPWMKLLNRQVRIVGFTLAF